MNNHRYDKLNIMIHLQNQKSHYKRIIEARTNIIFKNTQYRELKYVNKAQIKREKQIKENNNKLFNKISQIQHKKGLLQNVETQFYRRNLSLKNTQKLTNKNTDNTIKKQNNKIASKLLNASPIVGTIGEWKKKWKQFKKDSKRLQKFKKNKVYDPERYLEDTLGLLSKRRQSLQHDNLDKNQTNISQFHRRSHSLGVNDHINQNNKLTIISQKAKRYTKPKQTKREIKYSILLPKTQYQLLKYEINQIISKDQNNTVTDTQQKTSSSLT